MDIYLFIFGCTGSSLLLELFPRCGVWASSCSGFSCCGAQVPGHVDVSAGSVVWCTGLVALQPLGSSWTRDWTPGLLHWQADFLPLSHQGSPWIFTNWIVILCHHFFKCSNCPKLTSGSPFTLITMSFVWICSPLTWFKSRACKKVYLEKSHAYSLYTFLWGYAFSWLLRWCNSKESAC